MVPKELSLLPLNDLSDGVTIQISVSSTGVNLVATLCNDALGYVPTRDMFYDTIYESRSGSTRLDMEAGYIMAKKLISMKKK